MPVSDELLRRIIEDALTAVDSYSYGALDLSLAVQISKGCAAYASHIGVPVCISIVDASGVPILFNRMPGSLLVSVEIAPKKAYTCAVLNMSTEEAGIFTQKSALGLDTSLEGKIVLFAGGLPLRIGGRLAGGLGVSGGSPQQDKEIAENGLRSVGLM